MRPDAQLAIFAAVVALIPAWAWTRNLDPMRPGWAVRVCLALFSMYESQHLSQVAARRTRYPVREAFLVTWFLTFLALFGFGLFVWPGIAGP